MTIQRNWAQGRPTTRVEQVTTIFKPKRRDTHDPSSSIGVNWWLGLRVGFARPTAHDMDKNELDIAFLYRNTLHIIEYKAANLVQTGTGEDNKATDALYKMESLLKFGGLRTKGMVVDYRGELARSEANQKRAHGAGIAIASGTELRDLRGTVQRLWFAPVKSRPSQLNAGTDTTCA